MLYLTENHVRVAIDRIGGPTKAANLASVSNATIHNWLNAGRISNIEKARIVAKAAEMDVQRLRETR